MQCFRKEYTTFIQHANHYLKQMEVQVLSLPLKPIVDDLWDEENTSFEVDGLIWMRLRKVREDWKSTH